MEPGGPETCVEFIFFWFSTYLLPWFSLLNVSTHIKQCNTWKISSQMKLKQLLLVHSDFPTLLYIGGEAKDEKQCSSCVQSGPEKTYEHIQVSTLTVSETVLCVYICVCRLETCRWGLHILQKQYHFLKNHPAFFRARSCPAWTTMCLWSSPSRRSEAY